MEIRLHHDLAAFAELAAPLLHADPVLNTVALTVLTARLRPGGPDDVRVMLTAHDADGELSGVALRVGSWSLITSALPPEAAPAAAKVLAHEDPDLPGCTGRRENAEAFAEAWRAHTGDTVRVCMSQRLFALDSLRPPAGVPGTARVAGLEDIELLARWREDFEREVIPEGWPRPDDRLGMLRRQIGDGHGNLLWEVGGEPVALAAASRPAVGMSRIGPVWTPPGHRSHGYGSAVTAAASRWVLDAGARHVVLYTDLSNPVSNSIYRRLGYRPVSDAMDLTFDRA